MAFILPTFNIQVNIWRGPQGIPPVGAPVLSPFGNLTPGRRTANTALQTLPEMYLLLPALTDVRSFINAIAPDLLEIPAGSGRYYDAGFIDDVSKGFPTEHRLVVMYQRKPWPAPMP